MIIKTRTWMCKQMFVHCLRRFPQQIAWFVLLLGLWDCGTPVVHGQRPDEATPPRLTEEQEEQLLQLYVNLAWQMNQRGAFDRAETMFRNILSRDPNRPQEILGLATALIRQGKTDEAVTVLDDATDRYPHDPTLVFSLGQAYLANQDSHAATHTFEWAYSLNPGQPDLGYYLGSSYLGCQLPQLALDVMCGAPTSGTEMMWSQDLARGIAFSQLGLQSEAAGYFSSVSHDAVGTSLSANAQSLWDQMDEAVFGQPRLGGTIRVSERYDDNPGVIPATAIGGGGLLTAPTAGNLYLGNLSYALFRDYNHDITAGYNFLHTSNYEAHAFDLLDNTAYLSAVRRLYWRHTPIYASARVDYDHLLFGSNPFLQRFVATPSLLFVHNDWESSNVLFRYTSSDFLNQVVSDGSPFDLDSDNLLIAIIRQRKLFNRQVTAFVGYYFDVNLADGDNYDYNGHKAQIGAVWKTPWNGLEISASGDFYFRGYDNLDSFRVATRDDEEYSARIALDYPIACDWNASLEWNLDRNDSTINRFDYRRNTIDLALEYRFGSHRTP